MTTPWAKVVGDLRHSRSRAAIVVLAIAIGLSGFLGVLAAYAILQREINRGYLATNPASAILRTDAVDEPLLRAIVARDDVDDADVRRVVNGRIRAADGSWKRLAMFVIRDFAQLRISTVTPEAGEWPPSPDGLLIERDAFQVVQARIGDVLAIQTMSGRERQLRVAGRVHDAGQAQARMENMVYGYITPETLASLGEPTTLDRLYLLVNGPRFDASHVRRVAADVKASLERGGHVVRRMDIPPPGQHPHAVIMGLLLLLMAAFGLFALGLSGVIVLNVLFATVAAERRYIGVMKAIGGRRSQIAAIYLMLAALFGVAAIVLALPIGVAFGRVVSERFAILLNFDLVSLAIPPWVYLLVGVVGLVVPLASAVYPVATGTRITVRQALASTGLELSTFGAGRLERLLCGVNAGGRPWLLGIRNSLRRRTRSALTLTTLTIAGACFISALSVRSSLVAMLDRMFGEGSYGADARYAFDQHMLMIYVFLMVMAGVIGAVGGLGLVTTTSLNVLDRRRELGVLRAVGGSPGMVAAIVMVEAVFIAVVSWALSVWLAWAITAGVGRLIAVAMFRGQFSASLALSGIVGWLGIAIALAIASSVVPAMSASRKSVREAVNYE